MFNKDTFTYCLEETFYRITQNKKGHAVRVALQLFQ